MGSVLVITIVQSAYYSIILVSLAQVLVCTLFTGYL